MTATATSPTSTTSGPRKRRANTYWDRTSPRRRWDAIVIGSGMGGMTAAAMLAKQGKQVLVLEQHYVPGGFTHVFKRKGYTWDVGVHAVGEVTKHSMTGRLLDRLTDGRLEWASLGKVYEEFHFPDGLRVDFPDTPEQYRANLLAAFPQEQAAIDGYLARVREVAGAMKRYYLARVVPPPFGRLASKVLARKAQRCLEEYTRDVVTELTQDPRLRAVLTAQWAYYGSPPSRSSFAMQALVVKHFLHGGYYPVGGSEAIARELLRTVAEAGGWTRIVADVEEILCVDGRAIGVRLKGGEAIHADQVISAVGVRATATRLLPTKYREAGWAQEVSHLPPAPAHVCLYLGFKGDVREAGASGANKWFYETYDAEQEAWQVSPEGPLEPAPVLYCSFPSLKDPNHDPGPEQRHTGEAVTFVPWEAFAPWRDSRWKRRGPDYEAFKERMQETLLEQLLHHMPGLRDKVDYVELSTPLSTDHFCRPVQGSIYGLEPTPERFRCTRLRPHAPIKHLYFGGSEVTSVGVIGAMMGGVLAATAASPLGSFKLFRAV
jgi:all-trans-retinol 13,14-reductase